MTPDQFITERKFLKNVTEKTILWYRHSFKAFEGALESKAAVNQRITELRQRGVSAISVNTCLRCINAYFKWLHDEHDQPLIRIPKLKEEQKILQTFSTDHVEAILSYKAKGTNLVRARMVALTILDTGLRVAETLALTVEDVDFDHLTIKVMGKGGRERVVPFSVELRKHLFRFVSRGTGRLVFGTKNDTEVTVRNYQRDLKQLCKACKITGVRVSPHTLRHTFAVMYLRKGGNLEYLRRILGHSSVLTTQRYLRSLGVDDLTAVHGDFSPLGK